MVEPELCRSHARALEDMREQVAGVREDVARLDGKVELLVVKFCRASTRPGARWAPAAKTVGAVVGALGAAATAWAAAKGWL
jgi:hypothetical protein